MALACERLLGVTPEPPLTSITPAPDASALDGVSLLDLVALKGGDGGFVHSGATLLVVTLRDPENSVCLADVLHEWDFYPLHAETHMQASFAPPLGPSRVEILSERTVYEALGQEEIAEGVSNVYSHECRRTTYALDASGMHRAAAQDSVACRKVWP